MNIIKLLFIISLGSVFHIFALGKTETWLVKFNNHTDSDFVLSVCLRPILGKGGTVYTSKLADWNPILIVKAHEVGKKDVLLRDREGFGSQIKLEPKNSTLSPIYLNGSIKSSGPCERWYHGPYTINITNSEANLVDPFDKYDSVNRVRYCSYRDAEGVVHIYGDGNTTGVEIKNDHNMIVLDEQRVLVSNKKEAA